MKLTTSLLCGLVLCAGLSNRAFGQNASDAPFLRVEMYAGLTLTGAVGQVYAVEHNADPANAGGWSHLGTVALTNTTQLFIDETSPAFPKRFYRAVLGPNGMAFIPAGPFAMGDTFNEGSTSERPVHTVAVSASWMDRYEVTKALWDEVRAWGVSRGYSDLPAGGGKGPNHPVHSVSWYDVVKWCNARSEKEGRVPAYYTDAARTEVYRSGQVNVQNEWVKWNGGYRLPTEAEWEKAARGGLSGRRFPWGDTITHGQANYYSDSSYSYDISSTREYHPTFATGGFPYTSPVGYFAANGYGLHDMAGNVWEWCWDWWNGAYYSSSPGTDPRGPASGSHRVIRGGSWGSIAFDCRSASRLNSFPDSRFNGIGFRAVLAPGQP